MSDAAGLRGHAQEPSGVCLRATGGRDRTGAAGEIPTTPRASTACNTVGRMGDEATRRLTVVLGTETSEVLRAAASSRNREVDLAEPRWTAVGCTGARLAAVVERSRPPAPQRPRKYVVKVCPADGRGREGARHHAALERFPADFAARHRVSLEGDPIGLPGGGELLLQNIAGSSLARCRPMSEFAPADRALTAAAVARALTQDWNEETTSQEFGQRGVPVARRTTPGHRR